MKKSKELQVAIKAAREGGKVLNKHFGKKLSYKMKGKIDLATAADIESEKKIKSILLKSFPDYGFLGEETGKGGKRSDYVWVVDALDGTIDFFHKIPSFGISIALMLNNRPVVGVLYSVSGKELAYTEKGKGAYLNGKRPRVSKVAFGRALVTVDIGKSKNPKSFEVIKKLFKSVWDVRVARKSTVLQYLDLITGRTDGAIFFGDMIWDQAAGVLVLQEAGGKVTDFSGKEPSLRGSEFVASNSKTHNQILKIIKGGK